MAVLAIAHGVYPAVPAWPAGVAGWLAAALLVRNLGPRQSLQVGAIAAAGLALIAWTALSSGTAAIDDALSRNHDLLSMLVAISFLRLVSLPATAEQERLPRGGAAYLRTMLGVHLFGAVINVSSVIIIGDRLTRQRRLDPVTARLFSRAFSACAFWSPFIGGTAIVLAYIPAARLPVLLGIGIPMACCALAYVYGAARAAGAGALDDFEGYPIRFDSLRVPALLALGVLAAHELLPRLPILILIAAMSLTLTLVLLAARQGPVRAAATLRDHVERRLADMSGELCLFLAAGVLAVGTGALASAIGSWIPFAELDAGNASLTLCALVGLAVVGIHPIIVVSILAALLTPLSPDPNLVAAMFLMTWSIGNAASPLSGTHLILQGRYGIPSWQFSRWNLIYCASMLAIASAALHAYEWIAAR